MHFGLKSHTKRRTVPTYDLRHEEEQRQCWLFKILTNKWNTSGSINACAREMKCSLFYFLHFVNVFCSNHCGSLWNEPVQTDGGGRGGINVIRCMAERRYWFWMLWIFNKYGRLWLVEYEGFKDSGMYGGEGECLI